MEKKESKDLTQKNLESFPDVAADILNVFIYEGRNVVKKDALYPAPTETEYISPGAVLRNQLDDVSKYEMREGRIRIQYLFSNQSEKDGKMILRKAGYVGAVYREQYDGKTADKFLVVNLVLYWGKGHWNKVRSLKNFFQKEGLPEQLWRMVDDSRLHVFEMRNLQPEIRRLFHSDMRLVVDYLAVGNGFRSNRRVVHKEALIRLLRALGGDRNVEDTAEMRLLCANYLTSIQGADDMKACGKACRKEYRSLYLPAGNWAFLLMRRLAEYRKNFLWERKKRRRTCSFTGNF